MPKAKPPLPTQLPYPLNDGEVSLIKEAVERFFGNNAIIRNFGADPNWLQLHVETDHFDLFAEDECLGILNCKIARDHASLTVTQRGTRVHGPAKVAYQQGAII